MRSSKVAVALILNKETWEKVRREAGRRRIPTSLLLEEIIEEWFESEGKGGLIDEEFYNLLNRLDDRVNRLIDDSKRDLDDLDL